MYYYVFMPKINKLIMVGSCNCEILSLFYVLTVSSMLPRYSHNLNSLLVVFKIYCSVLPWFTLRSLGFTILDVLCFKFSMELWLLVTLLMSSEYSMSISIWSFWVWTQQLCSVIWSGMLDLKFCSAYGWSASWLDLGGSSVVAR